MCAMRKHAFLSYKDNSLRMFISNIIVNGVKSFKEERGVWGVGGGLVGSWARGLVDSRVRGFAGSQNKRLNSRLFIMKPFFGSSAETATGNEGQRCRASYKVRVRACWFSCTYFLHHAYVHWPGQTRRRCCCCAHIHVYVRASRARPILK